MQQFITKHMQQSRV